MLDRFSLFIIVLFFVACSDREGERSSTYFSPLDPTSSGVSFANNIVENDTLNYFTFPYLYMGGGVSVGDINNDGLTDIYLTGNMVPNRLYLNQGNNRFTDVTDAAGVAGDNRWYTGSTMADVNGDGWLDIYVSVSGKYTTTENQLFINNQDNTFSERAAKYGLNDPSPSIQSTFFDYDKDGLLDVYVATYPSIPVSLGNQAYQMLMNRNKWEDSGHLYRNQGDGMYKDVTEAAGVKNFSLALGIVASDVNNDNLPDLYVSNDFNIPDYLYLNQGDGTFKEKLKEATNHTSMFGMGVDAADFNNDGWMDILQVDMTPEDYKRSKTNMASMSPRNFYQAVDMGFHYQYMQNSLQLNNGTSQSGIPQFSDVGRFAGVATTDWSWGALWADLNNDGWKDALVTNGMKRDVNNNDVNQQIQANSETVFAGRYTPSIDILPSEPISNYVFRNQGDLSFEKTTEMWGLDYKGFSNGIAYADLDNDGDLDVIINNLDDAASVFINETNADRLHYLTVHLEGPENNLYGLDSRVTVTTTDQQQVQEMTLTRGFQSSVAPILHFGLGQATEVESVEIVWPDGKFQELKNSAASRSLTLDYKNAAEKQPQSSISTPLFKEATAQRGIEFLHQEDSYDDFRYEPLLPHRNSQQGPGLTVGDINGDGLEDFFVGNATGQEGEMYVQDSTGKFAKMDGPWQADRNQEDTGALLFDADNDGDLDLYVVSGGNNIEAETAHFQDRLYLNTTQGFVKSVSALPTEVSVSGKVVIPADYDNDGDIDLFVGGRLLPGRYPYPASSFIFQNEGGSDQQLQYRNVTNDVAPFLTDIGLVTTALWDDFDDDGQIDLVVAGEWMDIRFFKNEDGNFRDVSEDLGLEGTRGWWYSLHASDIDGDGDQDYIAGNLGLNYKYKSSEENPFAIYASDFDENGRTDIVLSYEKDGKQLPVRGRECSSQQMPIIQERFPTYEAFAEANLVDIYGEDQLEAALDYEIDTFASGWFENTGDKMLWRPFPNRVQLSSINAIAPLPNNTVINQRFITAGNLYTSEVETPRNDAGYGLLLQKQKSSKEFTSQSPQEIGLYVRGEVKEIAPIQLANNQYGYLFAINNDSLRIIDYQEFR